MRQASSSALSVPTTPETALFESGGRFEQERRHPSQPPGVPVGQVRGHNGFIHLAQATLIAGYECLTFTPAYPSA